MTEQGLSEVDINRLELFRSGIEDGTVTVEPKLEEGIPIVRLTVPTDEGSEEQIITEPDEVAYLNRSKRTKQNITN